MLIALKNGDGINLETIAAVRFGERSKSSVGDHERLPRVIVDFVQGSGMHRSPNSVVIEFDTDDAARELTTTDKPVNFREFP